jgi:dTDP-glucose 4,6-dehydratase
MGRTLNLVTGGAGFIGSRLVNALVDRGDEVVIIDDMSSGRIRNLEHAVQSGRATLIYADAALAAGPLGELVGRAASGPIDRIYHFASNAAVGSLIELALAHSARFLLASAPAGNRFAEAAVAAAVREHGLVGRIVRFFDCYGPAMNEDDGRLISALFRAALDGEPAPIAGTGKETRAPLYVDDAIALVRLVMERHQPVFEAVDARDRRRHSVEEIARAVARVVGVEFRPQYLPLEDDQIAQEPPAGSAAADTYGWRPKTPLDAGLYATYTWLREGRLAFA